MVTRIKRWTVAVLLTVVQYVWRRFMFTRIFAFLLNAFAPSLAMLVAAIFTRAASSLGVVRSEMATMLVQMGNVMMGTIPLTDIPDPVQRDLVEGAIGTLEGVLQFFGLKLDGVTGGKTVRSLVGDLLWEAAQRITGYPPEVGA